MPLNRGAMGNGRPESNHESRITTCRFMGRGNLQSSDANRGHEPPFRNSLQINETLCRFMERLGISTLGQLQMEQLFDAFVAE